MFSGLSDYLKKILPKRLFYRALLIVAIPVLVLQLVITIVFFDSLWIKTNKGMTRTLVNEINTFIEAYESEQTNKKELMDLFSLFLDLNSPILGESSVSYLFYPSVAKKIFAYNPQAKIIIVLRNPVERAFSHYLMDTRLGFCNIPLLDIINNPIKYKQFYQQFWYYQLDKNY